MIRTIYLENFKCFHHKQAIKLGSTLTLMYGKNGRGKSSIAQSLLILGQTMRATNSLETLYIMGDLAKQGTFDEIITHPSDKNEIKISLETEDEKLEIGFSSYPGKSQLARLTTFIINGQNRLETKTSNNEQNPTNNNSDFSLISKSIGTTSDINILQKLKEISVVTAGRLGPVNSILRNDSLRPDWLGVNGENLINVLANKGPEFIAKVEHYLSIILSGAAIRIPNPEADTIELKLNSTDGSVYFRPINVGFGYSYVLPVIVATLLAENGSILILENPEAHLHPGAQSRLTKFIIQIAKEKNLQVIIETHSDHVINGMRIAIKQELLHPSDGMIIHLAHEKEYADPTITFITCDKNGTLSSYPDDFMDEWTQQMFDLV